MLGRSAPASRARAPDHFPLPIQVQGCTDRAFAEAGIGRQRAGTEFFDDAGGVGSAV